MSLSNELNVARQREAAMRGFGEQPTEVTFCEVIRAHPENMTVDIEFTHSKISARGVPYLATLSSGKGAVKAVPSQGDIGIVMSTALNGRIVIGFLGTSEVIGQTSLAEGDKVESFGNSVVRRDGEGNFTFSTLSGASVSIGRDGAMTIASRTRKSLSEATGATDGVLESGTPFYEEVFFEDVVEVDYESVESLAEKLLAGEDIPLKERAPVFRISGVRKISSTGEEEVIPLSYDETDSVKVYAMEVVSADGSVLASLSFDKSGNIEIKAENIILDGNVINRPPEGV